MARNTHQKQTVLEVLAALRGQHPTAEMVFEQVLPRIPSISRATVYRVLNQYAAEGAIAQLHVPESAERYDDVMAPHCHLLCTACRCVVDLAAPHMADIPLPQQDASGCKITGVEVTFLGICAQCGNKA